MGADRREPPDRARGLAARLYGLLLRAYPMPLRSEYGDELRAVFSARLRAARRRGPAAFLTLWWRELRGALATRLWSGRHPSLQPPERLDRSPAERLLHAMDLLLHDLRFASRTLRKNAGFTLAAVLVLGIGIGANAAIFSVVDAVLLQPLPFSEPDRLLSIYETNPERGWGQAQVAAANFVDWRDRAASFSSMAAHNDWVDETTLTGEGEPEVLLANRVTGDFFRTLGVEMALGRGFDAEDTWAGGESKIVLSHALWTQRFGSDPNIVGRRLVLDDQPCTVVGVAPEGLRYPFPEIDYWKPTAWDREYMSQVWFRRAHGMRVIGRLADGVDAAAAATELQSIATALEQEYPETNVQMGVGVVSLHEWVVGDTRTPVLVLFAAVALVLLTACANVANMQLVRASRRGREMALRAALGAARGRLVRQSLTESLLLSALGGVAGLGIGAALVPLIARLNPDDFLRLDGLGLDPRVLVFTLLVTAATGVVFGLVPALRASRVGDGARVESSSRASAGPASGRTAGLLVALEVALVLPLAIGAGLMVRSLERLRTVDPGFDPADTVVLGYSLPDSRYPGNEEQIQFHRRLLEQVRQIPGVVSAGISTRLPFHQQRWSSDFRAESWPPDRYGVGVRHDEVSDGLFKTMRVPVLDGVTFSDAVASDRIVAVVNRALAEEYFPDGDAVGQRLCFDRAPEDCRYWYEVVGVVGNVRRVSLAEPEQPSIYAYILQDTTSAGYLMVRSERPTADVVATVQSVVHEIDPGMPFHTVTTLAELTDDSLARMHLLLGLIGAFAGVALLLAALGVYGVVAASTASRTREIGVRVTLGAVGGDIARTVLGRGLVPVALGLVAGIAGAALTSRLIESFLFQVPVLDPLTYVVAALVLLAAALLACVLPMRRALRIDPVLALREE